MKNHPTEIAAPGALSGERYRNVVDAFKETEAARKTKSEDYFINDRLAVTYVTLTTIILAFSYLVPVLPILILFAMWLPLPLFKGLGMLRPSRSLIWASLLPLFSMLSALWSDYSFKSLYLGIAFFSTIICIIIVNRTIRFKAFVQGMVLGLSFCMAATLQSGAQGTDVFSDTYALIGYFGSKNTVGGFAGFGMLASAGLFFIEKGFWRRILTCLGPFILCLVCLYLSKSATSLVAITVSLAAMLWAGLMCYLPRSVKFIIIATSIMLFVTLMTGIAMDGGKTLLNALGKDSTLTGRTYLWSEGYKIGWERPVLGHGYCAFWVQGQPQAERYWYEFLIPSRAGFHFHSTYIQVFVDLGLIGTLLVICQLFGACIQATRFALRGRMRAEGALLFGFSLMFLIRSFVEVEIVGVFSISALLFYTINLRLAQWVPATRTVHLPSTEGAAHGTSPR